LRGHTEPRELLKRQERLIRRVLDDERVAERQVEPRDAPKTRNEDEDRIGLGALWGTVPVDVEQQLDPRSRDGVARAGME
jgi:hypothetical protein